MRTRSLPRSATAEPSPVQWGSHEGIAQQFDDVIFLRLPEVKAITGLSKTSLYELIRANRFPAPVRLAPRAVAWVKSEVKLWAEERILASRSSSVYKAGRKVAQPVPAMTWVSKRKLA